MRRLLVGLVIFIFSIFIGITISEDPGLALFSYKQWLIEMPLWFAVVCFFSLFFISYLLLKLVNGIGFSLYRWRNWLQWRRKNKAYSKTNRGLIELIEGHWKNAEGFLVEGIPQSDAPLINYLAAAKAAHEQTLFDKRDAYLKQAHDVAPQAEVAIGLTQAQLHFNQGKLEQALATLTHLRQITPTHPLVLKLIQRIYIRLQDWSALLELLPRLEKAKVIDTEQLATFEKNIYSELLNDTKLTDFTSIQQQWQLTPKHVRIDSGILSCYAKRIIHFPESIAELESVLFKACKKTGNKELIRLYGLLPLSNPTKELGKAEGLIEFYPNLANLYLTLGRLCMRCQLWGKARSNFEKSLRLQPNAATFIEMGHLEESLNDSNAALKLYREGLLLLSHDK